jgi:hypothetical protein
MFNETTKRFKLMQAHTAILSKVKETESVASKVGSRRASREAMQSKDSSIRVSFFTMEVMRDARCLQLELAQ